MSEPTRYDLEALAGRLVCQVWLECTRAADAKRESQENAAYDRALAAVLAALRRAQDTRPSAGELVCEAGHCGAPYIDTRLGDTRCRLTRGHTCAHANGTLEWPLEPSAGVGEAQPAGTCPVCGTICPVCADWLPAPAPVREPEPSEASRVIFRRNGDDRIEVERGGSGIIVRIADYKDRAQFVLTFDEAEQIARLLGTTSPPPAIDVEAAAQALVDFVKAKHPADFVTGGPGFSCPYLRALDVALFLARDTAALRRLSPEPSPREGVK